MSERFSFDGVGSREGVSCGSTGSTRKLREMGERNEACCLNWGMRGASQHVSKGWEESLAAASLPRPWFVRHSGPREVRANMS